MQISSNPPLRPPPGLAPPPGFGGEAKTDGAPASTIASLSIDAAGQSTLGPMLDAALSNPDLTLAAASPSGALPFLGGDLLFTRNLPDSSGTPVSDSAFPPPVHSSPTMAGLQKGYGEPLTQALFDESNSGQNGFDVMDFLDSILNDGVSGEQEGDQNQDQGIMLPEASDVPLLSNPWASERKSRAAAYGISFDDADDESSESSPIFNVRAATYLPTEEGPTLGSIPLLTPAAILLSGQEEKGDEEHRVHSFYTSLMEE
jgi:hypothetical protein